MESKKITKSQKKHVRIQSLAEKYSCSRQYVRQILDGDSPANSALAQKILTDAEDILKIVERETKVTL